MNPFAKLPSHFRFFDLRKPTAHHGSRLRIERAVSTVVEQLESRQLLSSSIVVNSALDNVNDSNVTGSSVTLREAINYENTAGGGTITFDPSLAGQTITLTTAGDGTAGPSDFGISSNISIVGLTGNAGITLANATNNTGTGHARLFYVAPAGSLTIQNLTLTGGSATGGSSDGGGGGAGLGGAIFSQGSVNILQSTLVGNTATGGNGGDNSGANGGGGIGGNGNGNSGGGPNGGGQGQNGGFGGGGGSGGSGGFGGGGGSGIFGGGVGGFGGGGGSASLAAGFGGGDGGSGGGGGGMGGAIFNAAGSLSIVDSTLTGNTATGRTETNASGTRAGSGFGGAVFNLNGSLTLSFDTFAGNSAVAGVNLNYSPNNGTANGSDVYTLGLANVLATVGGPNIGPVNGAASASLTNNLFVNGTGGSDFVNDNISGQSAITGSNNLDTGSSGLLSGISTTVTSASLNLGALASNGGTTQTIPLLAGSPAVAAGTAVGGVTTDQRGVPRPATPDIGAYQYAYNLVVNSTADNVNDDNVSGPTVTLREAVNFANTYGGAADITFAPALAGQTITLDGSDLELNGTASPVTIDASSIGGITISGNTASNLASNVFQVDSGATVYFTDLTIINGQAIDGGGIAINIATVTITNCTLSNDTATTATGFGGGIFINGGALGTLTVTDSTLSNDTSGGSGGGICINGGTLIVTDSTLSNDTASVDGGGIFNGRGTLTVTDSTLSKNSGNLGGDLFLGQASSTSAYNSIFTDSIYGGWNGTNNLLSAAAANGPSSSMGTVEPTLAAFGLGTLGNYGGPTQTIALLPGSPAINAGSNALAVDADGNPLTTDQRGSARIVGGIVDIGAYESPLISTNTTVSDSSGAYTGQPFTATGTVTAGNTSLGSPAFTYYVATDTALAHPLPGAPTDVGSYVVVASYAAQGDYLASSNSAAFTITQATAIVNVTYSTSDYDGNAHAASASATGVNGEDLTGLLQLQYSSDGGITLLSAAPTNAGTYEVYYTFTGNTNYKSVGAPIDSGATETISQVSPNVTAIDAGGTYNGQPFAAGSNVTGINGTVLDNSGVSYTYYTVSMSGNGKGAAGTPTGLKGSGPTVPSNFSNPTSTPPADAGNYAVMAYYPTSGNYLMTYSGATYFTIAQATPTLTVTTTPGGPYTGNPVNTSATVTDLNGASLGSPTIQYFLASDMQQANPIAAPTVVGSYIAVISYAGSANYAYVSQTIPFSIAPATASVTVTANGGAYNGTPYAATAAKATGAGGLNDTTLSDFAFSYVGTGSTTYAATSTAPTNAGTYTLTASYIGDANHLAASSAPTAFTITKATSAVGVTDAGGTYTGTAYAVTAVSATGVGGLNDTKLSDFTLSYVGTGSTMYAASSVAPTNAGTYAVTATYIGDSNHLATNSSPTAFTIAQATPKVVVTDTGGVYSGLAFAATTTVAGVNGTPSNTLEGTGVTLTYYAGATAIGTPLASAPTSVGTYTVVASFGGTANYVRSSASTTFTVAQAKSVLTPVAATVAYGGTASVSTTLTTASGALLVGRTVIFSLNGKVIGTAVTNSQGVASFNASAAGITPGVYASGVTVSFAGDANTATTSATTSLTVTDATIVAKGSTLSLLNIALTLGTFTQARTGAAAGDYVVTVNWGDGSAQQQATVVADLFHPGQFDIVGPLHLYKKLFTTYAVTVTISTAGKFGASAGATTTFTTSIVA